MRRRIMIIVISAFATCAAYSQNKGAKIKSLKKIGQLTIDSSLKVAKGGVYYRLMLRHSDTTYEVYRVKNRDHSLEFKRKFSNKPLNYICYEVYDLPTGVTWNILYEMTSNQVYITDHYDMHAMGDTFIGSSVNFSNKIAKVMSYETKKPYNVKLTKIWPR